MIVADRLTRKYGDTLAVADASFEIRSGEIVGLLGHNGAGKTTLMKMMTGFLEPTAGGVRIDDIDLDADRTRAQELIGYLPENTPVYPDMTVVDYLDYAASLRGIATAERPAAIRAAVEATDLSERIAQPIAELSRGLRQRVGVAQAILHAPKIVILDEPTNGLDPTQIKHMRALIRRLSQSATVILSTHIMQEVEAVCDRVIVVDRGRIALDTRLADLKRQRQLRVVASMPEAELIAAVGAIDGAARVEVAAHGADPTSGRTVATIAWPTDASADHAGALAPALASAVINAGYELHELHALTRDLEAIFGEISAGRATPDGEDAPTDKLAAAA